MNFRDSILASAALILLAAPAIAATKPAKPVPKPAATVEQADSTDPTFLASQARAALARGENDLAERLAQAAIVADPKLPASYDALGDIYAANHQPDYARVYYNEALSIDPTDTGATTAIAVLDRAGDSRKADADGAKPVRP